MTQIGVFAFCGLQEPQMIALRLLLGPVGPPNHPPKLSTYGLCCRKWYGLSAAIGYWWGISFSLIFLGKLGGPRKPIYGLVSDQAYNGSILTSIIYYIIPSPETGRFARFRPDIWEYKSIFWLLWYLSTCWNRFITRVPSLQSRRRFYLHTYSLYT